MKWIVLAVTWALFLGFGLPWIPALGPLLDVRTGIWDYKPQEFKSGTLKGLKKPVTVTIDKAGVPHIFAESAGDLYLAQGYLTAAFRLFQLDVSTRATAGRLSEFIGPRGKEFDRFFVAMGMRKSNRERSEIYRQDPGAVEMMQNFTDGVNRWMETLTHLPPEYKILGAKLTPYELDRVVHMSKILTWNLAGRSADIALSEIQQQIGTEKTLDLYPEYLPTEDLVWTKKFETTREPERLSDFPFTSALNFEDIPRYPLPNPGQGSNNWTVAPAKSATGASLFANDTHLSLSLPSIWMEAQLSCPEFNVYGVSLVGVPGIINGFNKDVAWGPTNGGTDVHDFYEVEFKDEDSNLYKEGDQWLEARVEKEVIRAKGGFDEEIDVTYTNRGVVIHREGKLGLASDWSGHRSGNEMMAVRGLYDSRNVDECMDTFKRWLVPLQNFMCADRANIGWVHAGFIPKRAVGHGRFIMDGRTAQRGLQEALPEEFRPKMKNPPEGYIESANQKIVPQNFPYYFGWDYEPPFRGMSIRRGLTAKEKLTPQDLIELQNSNYDVEAEIMLPLFLKALDRGALSDRQKKIVERLEKWDFHVRGADLEPSIYKEWIVQFRKSVFDDDFELHGERVLYPRDLRLTALLENLLKDPNHSDAYWVDNQETDEKESLAFIATVAFQDAWDELDGWFTPIEKFTWNDWQKVQFRHVARIPGFGSDVLERDASVESIPGVNKHHGAVYKIVVATGDWPEAWISVPGGLTGDPFAKDFETGVQEWARGEMRKVEYYRGVEEAKAAAAKVIELKPEGT